MKRHPLCLPVFSDYAVYRLTGSHLIACTQPAGAAFCTHDTRKIVDGIAFQTQRCHRLGSSLSTVAVYIDGLIGWQDVKFFLHTFFRMEG